MSGKLVRDRIPEIMEAASANAPGDWACAECRPESDHLIVGFRCAVHEARVFAALPPSLPAAPAPTADADLVPGRFPSSNLQDDDYLSAIAENRRAAAASVPAALKQDDEVDQGPYGRLGRAFGRAAIEARRHAPQSEGPVGIADAVDALERIMHPEGRCAECGGGKPYWKHRPHDHEFRPAEPEQADEVAGLRAEIEEKIAILGRPDGTHKYDRGGIHRGVEDCGACSTLHTLRWVNARLAPARDDTSGGVS